MTLLITFIIFKTFYLSFCVV